MWRWQYIRCTPQDLLICLSFLLVEIEELADAPKGAKELGVSKISSSGAS